VEPVVLELTIVDDADDVEEHGDWDAGKLESLTSSDLEMPYEDTGMGEIQIIGLRYINVAIPKGATITAASVQFQVDEDKDGTLPVNLVIEGELSANARGLIITLPAGPERQHWYRGVCRTGLPWVTAVLTRRPRTSLLSSRR
jgi:hypothetical protein